MSTYIITQQINHIYAIIKLGVQNRAIKRSLYLPKLAHTVDIHAVEKIDTLEFHYFIDLANLAFCKSRIP